RTGLDRLHCGRDITVSTYENDWKPASQTGKLLLKLWPTQPGHLHIEQNAGGPAIQRRSEQLLGGFVERNFIFTRAQKLPYRRSKGPVFVDNMNGSRRLVHLSKCRSLRHKIALLGLIVPKTGPRSNCPKGK